MSAHRAEELADERLRRPAGERDRAAGPADAQQLRRGPGLVRGEHAAEHGGDRVERIVRERQRLGIAFHEPDVEALGRRALASALEQGGYVVDADGRAAEPGGRDRGVGAARGDVEHAPAGVQVGGVAELLGHQHDQPSDDGEVAARPGLLLPLLDRPEVGTGGRFQRA
jgi:hypothetical protein